VATLVEAPVSDQTRALTGVAPSRPPVLAAAPAFMRRRRLAVMLTLATVVVAVALAVAEASGHDRNNVNSPSISGDGGGYLYVVDAFSGKILYKIATYAGDATTTSGLAQINNFIDNAAVSNTTRMVYAGDLLGNIWRFDVNDTIAPSGREATLVGVATDTSGTRQPITTKPELA
jgi:hypothetical protein